MNKKITLEINRPNSFRPSFNLKRTISQIINLLKIKKIDLSLAFVTQRQIKKINWLYRRKNKPTDVLSFVYSRQKNFLSGEILICWPEVRNNAKENQADPKLELQKVLIHSLLHLLGHSHEKIKDSALMKKKEEQILSQLTGKKFFHPGRVKPVRR